MGRGVAWLDMGTPESLIESSQFVRTLEVRQGLKMSCLEEIAFSKGFINQTQLSKLAEEMPNSVYGNYVKKIAQNPN
jgi:glucose-1-phosphate thymidylyltransferase